MTEQEFKNEWRPNQIKEVGLHIQLQAEAKNERERNAPLVKVCDDRSGCYKLSKPDVTAVMKGKGEYSTHKKYFTSK